MLFSFFLIIDLHFLIHAAIAQISNPISEPMNPIGMSSKDQGSYIFSIKPIVFNISIDSFSLNIFWKYMTF